MACTATPLALSPARQIPAGRNYGVYRDTACPLPGTPDPGGAQLRRVPPTANPPAEHSVPLGSHKSYSDASILNLLDASLPRTATNKLSLLAGPETCRTRPTRDPHPTSFLFLRGLKLAGRVPPPIRGREAFAFRCGNAKAPAARSCCRSSAPLVITTTSSGGLG